jgi:hypothetical protein
VKEGIHCNGTYTLLWSAIKITCNMYIYFDMVMFTVYATSNNKIYSVHINNHNEMSYKTKWSLPYTRINYTHCHLSTCPKIYHRYKDNIWTRITITLHSMKNMEIVTNYFFAYIISNKLSWNTQTLNNPWYLHYLYKVANAKKKHSYAVSLTLLWAAV